MNVTSQALVAVVMRGKPRKDESMKAEEMAVFQKRPHEKGESFPLAFLTPSLFLGEHLGLHCPEYVRRMVSSWLSFLRAFVSQRSPSFSSVVSTRS